MIIDRVAWENYVEFFSCYSTVQPKHKPNAVASEAIVIEWDEAKHLQTIHAPFRAMTSIVFSHSAQEFNIHFDGIDQMAIKINKKFMCIIGAQNVCSIIRLDTLNRTEQQQPQANKIPFHNLRGAFMWNNVNNKYK